MTSSALLEPAETVTLWEDDENSALTVSSACSPDFVSLLEQTRFGSSGLRYRRLGVAEALAKDSGNAYVSLHQRGKLAGAYVLKPQRLVVHDRPMLGVYRSALCLTSELRGKGCGKLIASQTLDWLDTLAVSKPLISYGCIDVSNRESLAVLDACGARQIGQLQTQMVYRQWPRRRVELVRVSNSDVAKVYQQAYSDCAIKYDSNNDQEGYAVMRGSDIVASANATVVRLNFERIGQPWDFLGEHVFAHIGPARRRFNPRNFTYLKLDDVVAVDENLEVWPGFLSTLMAEHGVPMAIFSLDPASQVAARLQRSGIFGRVAKATRQRLSVVARGHGEPDDWLGAISESPLAIGPSGQ